jgi:hypothetical protein
MAQQPYQNQAMGGGWRRCCNCLCILGRQHSVPSAIALPLADFFPVTPGFGLANSAAAASSESEDEGGTSDA